MAVNTTAFFTLRFWGWRVDGSELMGADRFTDQLAAVEILLLAPLLSSHRRSLGKVNVSVTLLRIFQRIRAPELRAPGSGGLGRRRTLNTLLGESPSSFAISRPLIPAALNLATSPRCTSRMRGLPSLTPRLFARLRPCVVRSVAIAALDSRTQHIVFRSVCRDAASTMRTARMTIAKSLAA